MAGVILLMTAAFVSAQTLYKIESVNSGKVIDVYINSLDEGADICQSDWNGGLNQQWTLQDVGDGLSKIVSARSGMIMGVLGAYVDEETPVVQLNYNGGGNQHWRIEDIGDGRCIIVRSDTGSVIDVYGRSMDEGVNICQTAWAGEYSQQWRLIPVGEVQPVTGDSITFSANPVTGLSYEVYANNVQNAVRVLFPTWTDANGQDELVWHEGEYDAANNRWKSRVDLGAHNEESGSYTTYVYAMGANGEWHHLFGATVEVVLQKMPTCDSLASSVGLYTNRNGTEIYKIYAYNVKNASSVYCYTEAMGQSRFSGGVYNASMNCWEFSVDLNDYGYKEYWINTYFLSTVYATDANGDSYSLGEVNVNVDI